MMRSTRRSSTPPLPCNHPLNIWVNLAMQHGRGVPRTYTEVR